LRLFLDFFEDWGNFGRLFGRLFWGIFGLFWETVLKDFLGDFAERSKGNFGGVGKKSPTVKSHLL
jgi:hypothetical protein